MATWLLVVVTVLVSVCLNNRVTATDGCEDGYTRCAQELCGNKCQCGGGDYDYTDDSSWCCATINTTCAIRIDHVVICKEALLQSLTASCNGKCNFWPGDSKRNMYGSRSYVKCASGDQCVNCLLYTSDAADE